MINMKNKKISAFFSELFLIICLSVFTVIISKDILDKLLIIMLILIILAGRLIKTWNMTIGTYLIILTLVLNAVGLQQQNILTKERLKQFKREEKKEAARAIFKNTTLNLSGKDD